MTEYIEITGGFPLRGTVRVSGAKNAALPMLLASLLTEDTCTFENVPNLEDVNLTLHLLEHFGASTDFDSSINGGTVVTSVPKLVATEASYSLVKALRASFWVLGPLLARGRAARVALPGGDIIGARPVDIHLAALEKMGAEIRVKHGVVYATAVTGLKPSAIQFRFPSVGATHQVLMAAALAPGVTTIDGAAREPEIVALAEMLTAMGAKVLGAGTSHIEVHGASSLRGVRVRMIGDRIEAGTYLLAAAATGGAITAQGVNPNHLSAFLECLSAMGAELTTTADSISISCPRRLRAAAITTAPFPGFPTDLQAPYMALASSCAGQSSIDETVFEGRFGHVAELCRMGAQIRVVDRSAIIDGCTRLSAAMVEAHDIRAGAALVIAALAAEGTSQIHEIRHLRRGYELLEEKLRGLGARVGSRQLESEDFYFSGC